MPQQWAVKSKQGQRETDVVYCRSPVSVPAVGWKSLLLRAADWGADVMHVHVPLGGPLWVGLDLEERGRGTVTAQAQAEGAAVVVPPQLHGRLEAVTHRERQGHGRIAGMN